MKTLIVNIPDRDENMFISLFKKLKFKARVLSEEEQEEMAMAKWIDEGKNSGEVSEKVIFETLRRHGVKI